MTNSDTAYQKKPNTLGVVY